MTVQTSVRKARFIGDGVNTAFPFAFKTFQTADLVLTQTSIAGVDTPVSSLFSIVLNNDQEGSPGGTVTYPTSGLPMAAGIVLTVTGVLSETQLTDLTNAGGFFPKTITDRFDYLTILIQQVTEKIGRALLGSASDVGANLSIGTALQRAGRYLGFDQSGNVAMVLPPNLSPANGTPAYGLTAAEQGAGIVPVNFGYAPGNVLRYGADPLGILDSTAAIQKAITAMQAAGGGIVLLPPGTYFVSSTINIISSVSLVGAGRFFTKVLWTSTTLTVFNVASDQAIYMSGLQMSGPVNSSSGRMVQIVGSGTNNSFSIIEDCLFSGGYSQVYSTKALTLLVDGNYFTGFQQSGVHIENQFNADAGDSTVIGNTFSNSPNTTTSVCIEQFSSGGLKVQSNKLNTGAYGFRLAMASGISTSDLIISGNSIENQAIAAINIASVGGGALYTNIDISGNQIALVPVAISATLSYAATSGWVIGSNRISLNTAAAGVGISLQWVSGVNISGNTLFPGAVTQTAISTDVNTSGNMGLNTYQNVWAQKLSVAAGSMYILPSVVEAFTQSVTCSSVYGALFFGTVAVVFPTAFDLPPTVDCDFGSVSGGVSAEASSITKSGFTLLCLSVTSGGTGLCNYRARGIV